MFDQEGNTYSQSRDQAPTTIVDTTNPTTLPTMSRVESTPTPTITKKPSSEDLLNEFFGKVPGVVTSEPPQGAGVTETTSFFTTPMPEGATNATPDPASLTEAGATPTEPTQAEQLTPTTAEASTVSMGAESLSPVQIQTQLQTFVDNPRSTDPKTLQETLVQLNNIPSAELQANPNLIQLASEVMQMMEQSAKRQQEVTEKLVDILGLPKTEEDREIAPSEIANVTNDGNTAEVSTADGKTYSMPKLSTLIAFITIDLVLYKGQTLDIMARELGGELGKFVNLKFDLPVDERLSDESKTGSYYEQLINMFSYQQLTSFLKDRRYGDEMHQFLSHFKLEQKKHLFVDSGLGNHHLDDAEMYLVLEPLLKDTYLVEKLRLGLNDGQINRLGEIVKKQGNKDMPQNVKAAMMTQ